MEPQPVPSSAAFLGSELLPLIHFTGSVEGQKTLWKLQENFQSLMGERSKGTEKALFWIMGANGESTSGTGDVGTVGEVALG